MAVRTVEYDAAVKKLSEVEKDSLEIEPQKMSIFSPWAREPSEFHQVSG